MIFKKYDIPEGTLKNWIVKYKSGGFDKLTKKIRRNILVNLNYL